MLAPGRAERAMLGLLCAATLAFWSVQYHPFHFPNNDHYSFAEAARSFARAELPDSTKRGPIFPLLLALLAPLVPAAHPELHAALLLNLLLSLGVLVLVFVFASRLLGAGAMLPTALLAANPHFHAMALDGLVEPSLGFLVLLSFLLFERRSPWQYAAAAAAALSRVDCTTLIFALFVANWCAERRLGRHLGMALLAALPCLCWNALGVLGGAAGGNYLALMQDMGFAAAPEFLVVCLREPFYGWSWSQERLEIMFPIFLAAVALPILAGIRVGWRAWRPETVALLLFAALDVTVIVFFGISKARYVYPTQWTLLIFFSAGSMDVLRRLLGDATVRLPRAAGPALVAAAILTWAVFTGRRVRFLAAEAHVVPMALNVAYLLLVFGVVAVHAVGRRARGSLGLARAAALLALVAPVLVAGIQRKERFLHTAHYANYSAYLAARWVQENRTPGDRFLTLHATQIGFLIDAAPGELINFRSLVSESTQELVREAKQRGVSHLIYTWRKPVATRSDAHYARTMKTHLTAPFADGGVVPGFELLATLPLPPELERRPVQIYRLRY